MFIRECAQRGDARGRHRQHHALLRLADPHLGGRQACVLQWCAIQVHGGTQHATHLAHRARESTCTTIGHAVEKRSAIGVASRQQRVQRPLLRDRCANLHRVAEFVGVRVGQFGAGECRAVDAITTRAASQHHDHVTLARRTTDERARHQAHHAAVHQRIAHVARIEPHRPVQGWNAHAVAVVAHALHHLPKDARGLQATLGHLHVGRRNAEHVGGGDGLGGKAGAHHVSNASTNAGGRTTIGLDRARVVVRLHLDAHGVRFVEGDHARVVHEHAQAPVDGARLRRIHQLMRCGGHSVLQQVVHHQRIAVTRMARSDTRARKQRWRARRKALFGVAHAALQRLVNAVLAPGLRDGLQLDLARLAALAAVLRLHGTHLVQAQEQVRFAAQTLKRGIVQIAQLHMTHLGRARLGLGKVRWRPRRRMHCLHHGVRQQALPDRGGLRAIHALQIPSVAGQHAHPRTRQLLDRQLHAFGGGVGHARQRKHLHHEAVRGRGTDRHLLRHRVCKQLCGHALQARCIDRALQQIHLCASNTGWLGKAMLRGGALLHARSTHIRHAILRSHLDPVHGVHAARIATQKQRLSAPKPRIEIRTSAAAGFAPRTGSNR